MKRKSALVLGSTGQGGSFMVKHLLKKNYVVHGLVRKSATTNLSNIKDILNHKNFKIEHGDLLDLILLSKIQLFLYFAFFERSYLSDNT